MNSSGWKFCVIGDPIAHSLSPLMHRFFLDKFGIVGTYDARRVPASELERQLRILAASGVQGINVTTPHKNAIAQYMDQLTPEAIAIGSVNTVKIISRQFIGHNTDAIGFENSLQLRGFSIAGKRATLFGTGGAARAVIAALIRNGSQRVTIVGRQLDKAIRLVEEFLSQGASTELVAIALGDLKALEQAIASAHLLINATTVGMGSMMGQSILPDAVALPPGILVYDLIYRPYRTKLIQQAEQRGLSWMNGLEMLILQGIASLRFWVDRPLALDQSSFEEVINLLRREICQESLGGPLGSRMEEA